MKTTPPNPLSDTIERALLINPPVYDTRLPWAKWQQPTLLLRLGTYLRQVGTEVKLLDALSKPSTTRLHRERVALLDLDGLKVPKWRYGLAKSALIHELQALAQDGWHPDKVFVECFTTFWWEGAAEAVQIAKEIFPKSRVVLIGSYPILVPDHAREHSGADEITTESWPALFHLPSDLSLYANPPDFMYLSFGQGSRTADEVADEIAQAFRRNVRHFAFVEHSVARRFTDLYRSVLEKVIAQRLRIKFYALGNIAPSDLVMAPDLPELMKQAGYEQINFSDDRDASDDPATTGQLIDDYREAASLCHGAGFAKRSDALCAGVCIGRPGEDIAARVRLATFITHHIGSVIFWPYQPSSQECSGMPLEDRNGKLFPLRAENGLTYRDYLNLLGLATVLNAKYREYTFDFMGDGLIPNLLRDSIARRGWEPNPEVKGSLKLPLVVRS